MRSRAKQYYQQYYFLTGILIYFIFVETGDNLAYESAKSYFMRGLKISEEGRFSETVKNLIQKKQRSLDTLILLNPIDFKFISEEFPDINY